MAPPLDAFAGPDVEPGEQEEDERDGNEDEILHRNSLS
jgi:hypothetical protein